MTRHGGCYLKLLSSVRIVGFLLALIFVPVGVGFRHHLFNSIPWDQDDALERGTLMEMGIDARQHLSERLGREAGTDAVSAVSWGPKVAGAFSL